MDRLDSAWLPYMGWYNRLGWSWVWNDLSLIMSTPGGSPPLLTHVHLVFGFKNHLSMSKDASSSPEIGSDSLLFCLFFGGIAFSDCWPFGLFWLCLLWYTFFVVTPLPPPHPRGICSCVCCDISSVKAFSGWVLRCFLSKTWTFTWVEFVLIAFEFLFVSAGGC